MTPCQHSHGALPRRIHHTLAVTTAIFLAVSGWNPASCFGATDGQLRLISIHDAIALALENNLSVKIDRLGTDIQQTRIAAARGEFDPTFNVRAVYESIETPQNQREFTATQNISRGPNASRLFDEENYLFDVSLDGRLPYGTEWSLVSEVDRLKNTLNIARPPSLFYPEYDSFVGLRFTQPILRDFGRKTNLAKMRIAASEKEVADLAWRNRLHNVIAEVASLYYDLIFADEDITIKRKSIANARELRDANKKRVEQGVAAPVEVRQAEVAASVREEQLLAAQYLLREKQNALLRQISSDFDITAPVRYEPTGQFRASVTSPSPGKLLDSAIQYRPEYQSTKTEIEKQNIRLHFAKNQMYPRLDLVGTFGGNGLQGSAGNSVGDVFQKEGVQWSAGVVFSFPLGRRTAKANLRQVELEKSQLVLNLKQIEIDLAVQIDTAIARLNTSRARLKTAADSADLARMTVDEEDTRLEEGLTNTFQVLEAQKQLMDAQTRELAALADLNKSVINLYLASGTILDHFGVQLDQPPLEAGHSPAPATAK